jgi:hypothetical protein
MACPDCFSGHKHDGTPLGKEDRVHGRDCYVTGDANAKAIIVFIPDAFGWKFNNNRILADHYAARIPARVLLPEFMEGTFTLYQIFSAWTSLEERWPEAVGMKYKANGNVMQATRHLNTSSP